MYFFGNISLISAFHIRSLTVSKTSDRQSVRQILLLYIMIRIVMRIFIAYAVPELPMLICSGRPVNVAEPALSLVFLTALHRFADRRNCGIALWRTGHIGDRLR